MSEITCSNCRYWDNSSSSSLTDAETGKCRRSSPGFDSRTGIAVWPFTEETDWCGESRLYPLEENADG